MENEMDFIELVKVVSGWYSSPKTVDGRFVETTFYRFFFDEKGGVNVEYVPPVGRVHNILYRIPLERLEKVLQYMF